MSAGKDHQSVEAAAVPRLPALDGLRGVAVIAVMLYHAGLPGMPGGFLGVEMFFVLSGCLITSLLLAEWRRLGGVNLARFWRHRVRRLLPALAVLLVVVTGMTAAFLPDETVSLRGDALSTVLQMNNWYQVFSQKSYFETVGRPPLLRHLWSLAVEEQFYLVWPVLFCLLMGLFRPRVVFGIVLAGSVASAIWMGWRFEPGVDPSRVYYGTDTRACGLLLGSALAFVWQPGRNVRTGPGALVDGLGLVALAGLGIACVRVHEFMPLLYRGGFSLVGIGTAMVIVTTGCPQARITQAILGFAPLRWAGERSYGLYLWHFPIFMMTRPQLDVEWGGLPALAGRLVLATAMAAVSYQWVERPIRRGALGRAWMAWRTATGQTRTEWAVAWNLAVVAAFMAVALAGLALVRAVPASPPAYLAKMDKEEASAGCDGLEIQAPAAAILEASPEAASSGWSRTGECASAAAVVQLPAVTGECYTAIGDSVMLGAAEELRRALGGAVVVDAGRGRLPRKTVDVIQKLRETGRLHPVVILHVGDNGIFDERTFDRLMVELRSVRKVVVVNVKVPRAWEGPNNAMLALAVGRYPNAVLVDWHAASMDRPDLFWKDGLHLRPEGCRLYAGLIGGAAREPPRTLLANVDPGP